MALIPCPKATRGTIPPTLGPTFPSGIVRFSLTGRFPQMGGVFHSKEVRLMAGKKQLPPVRIATEEDRPAPPMSLRAAAEHGTRLDELKAMRLILVTHMENENTLARDLAALTRQVREISKEIESLSPSLEKDDLGKAADTDDEVFNPHFA